MASRLERVRDRIGLATIDVWAIRDRVNHLKEQISELELEWYGAVMDKSLPMEDVAAVRTKYQKMHTAMRMEQLDLERKWSEKEKVIEELRIQEEIELALETPHPIQDWLNK